MVLRDRSGASVRGYRITSRAGAATAPVVRVRFDLAPCSRCGRIHVPGEVYAETIKAAGGIGKVHIEQSIVVGSCVAEAERDELVLRVWGVLERALRWLSALERR